MEAAAAVTGRCIQRLDEPGQRLPPSRTCAHAGGVAAHVAAAAAVPHLKSRGAGELELACQLKPQPGCPAASIAASRPRHPFSRTCMSANGAAAGASARQAPTLRSRLTDAGLSAETRASANGGRSAIDGSGAGGRSSSRATLRLLVSGLNAAGVWSGVAGGGEQGDCSGRGSGDRGGVAATAKAHPGQPPAALPQFHRP